MSESMIEFKFFFEWLIFWGRLVCSLMCPQNACAPLATDTRAHEQLLGFCGNAVRGVGEVRLV
jgi:polyferredoxin